MSTNSDQIKEWVLILIMLAIILVGLSCVLWIMGSLFIPMVLSHFFKVINPRLAWGLSIGIFLLFLWLGILRQRQLESDPNRTWP